MMVRARQVPLLALMTLLIVIAFLQALARTLMLAPHMGRESYGITEWLINYSAGFVRRGWPGELVALLSQASGWQANYITIWLSAALFLWLALLLARRIRGQFPLVLLFSPVLLGLPLFGDFIIRKDVLGVLLLVCCLGIRRCRASFPLRMAALNLVVVAAILSHESFFFYAVPALIVLTLQELGGGIRCLPAAVALMAPALLAFGLCVIHKGDAATAQVIHDSWGELWRRINPADCCLNEPGGSIEGLRWTSSQALELPYNLLSTFSGGIYVPLAWVLSMAACFLLLTTLVRPHAMGDRGRLAGILLFQLCAVLPLFVVGWDFGRWIFFWTSSSLLLYLEGASLVGSLTLMLDRRLARMAGLSARCQPLLYVSCLLIGIPGCCWEVERYLIVTPLYGLMSSSTIRNAVASLL